MANTQQSTTGTDAGNPKPDAGAKVSSDSGDGRRDKGQQKQNQEHLGVDTDHKTDAMKKHHRGTFP